MELTKFIENARKNFPECEIKVNFKTIEVCYVSVHQDGKLLYFYKHELE